MTFPVAAVLVTTLVLAGESAGGPPAPAAPEPPSCRQAPGLDLLLTPGTALLLGEMHGTIEGPAFTADALCRALAAGRSVTLGLEIPREDEPLFLAYLTSEGSEKDRAALLGAPFWHDMRDGRNSQAMLGLVETVRRHHRAGRPVRLVLFDQRGHPDGRSRDRAMADRLRQAVRESPQDVLVVLSGNIHTRTVAGVPWDKQFEMAGYLLSRDFPGLRLVSLNMTYSGGTAWACIDGECKVHPLKGDGPGAGGGKVTLHETGADERGYHGRYDVGSLTASEPAVPAVLP